MTEKDRGLHRYKNVHRPRKSQRVGVAVDVEIGGAKGGAMGRAHDLTAEGVKIRCPHSYGVGDRIALTLHVPKFSQHFDFAAEVKWVEPAGSMEEFFLGCAFVHTPETAKLMQNLLWELSSGSVPEALRIPGRKTTRRNVRGS